MSFTETVIAVHDALESAGIPHAFGGALALANYGEPRMTVDIDVNVFSAAATVDAVTGALAGLGYAPERDPALGAPIAGIRYQGEQGFPVDVFLPLDEPYDEVAARTTRSTLAGRDLPFLSLEDLIVFKLSFNRDKDWADLRALLAAGARPDGRYVERQLLALRGPTMHPRLARLRSLLPPTP